MKYGFTHIFNFLATLKEIMKTLITFIFILFAFQTTFSQGTKKLPDTKDSFTDFRDNKIYKTIKIGNQVWMAENLNFNSSLGSSCYGYKNSNCDAYGRLYIWETAKVVCPSGWHLPSDTEWNILLKNVGSDEGKKLKSASGWIKNGNGTDAYGFAALPGGDRNFDEAFNNLGSFSTWWSSTEVNESSASGIELNNNSPNLKIDGSNKDYGFSVRCIKDN